jgi:hypothetical protein
MYATVRRYEGIDESRADELKRKVDQSLMPRLSKLPGFSGYFLIESGKDGMTSFGVFETPAQGEESTRVATKWLHEEKLDAVLPNPPKVTGGEVIAHATKQPILA